ncbi:unnamed protein product [Rotaria sordida]|uniref:Poly [ADP-ribose] polymerase n=1 Tax=Rotaria sordida TaxID=392033 RepID=A0A813RS40_9BILA|nr:unnamed protein product [Rotaria sordida]CAF0836493.1 unnamed protein product [Rotaria sordida]
MNQLSSKTDLNDSDDDSTESDHLSPQAKRHCSSSNSQCLPNQSPILIDLVADDIKENKEECKSCGKQEILLRTFNCPSLHYFCLNCIFNWTQKHIQTKTPPICLAINCGYLLKNDDLDDLPITIKDHQILLQLIQINIDKNNKINNFRIKCDKCDLYIDQHNFFIHNNECLGRSLTIPCEICYCPVSINDYEQHMLICTNDDNSTLAKFLFKHLQNPNIDEKLIKSFICSWQRKHRRAIDVYEMIEEFNQTNGFSKEICDICKNTIRSDDFFFINCYDNHSLCLLCYKQRLQNQMNNDQILTCHLCSYHLQDKDLSETRILTNEEIHLFQNYQNKKVLELYSNLYGAEDTDDINSTVQPQNDTIIINNNDTARRKCDLCSKQHSYGNIFVLHCNCKICYDCFANEVNRQRITTNEILICSLCRTPIKHNDLSNLRLAPVEIQTIQIYQQGKLFESEHAIHFNRQKSNQTTNSNNNNDDNDDDDFDFDLLLLNHQQCLPKYWTLPMLTNFSRHTLYPESTEYKFVADKFHQSWTKLKNQHPIPVPPPISVRPPLPLPPPPPSSVFVPPINNPPPAHFQPPLLQQFGPIQVSMNNNTIPTTNQQPANHGFGTLRYPVSIGTNTMVLPPQLPPSLPASSSVPFLPQPIYRLNSSYAHPTGPNSLTIKVPKLSSRQTRPITHGNGIPQILQIERIQNQRWYKQYSAHECEFRQKLNKQTEQWLFHGCDERSSKNIEVECFNRSYAGQHAAAFGQGCYFARDSLYSHSYALPDRNGIRRMFLARVLVGNTTQGNSAMRVPPPGYDTTGDGQSIFVTYHDSQAYAEYLICYR